MAGIPPMLQNFAASSACVYIYAEAIWFSFVPGLRGDVP
jgi:hypothetical protein